jgi:hypothetical protein
MAANTQRSRRLEALTNGMAKASIVRRVGTMALGARSQATLGSKESSSLDPTSERDLPP